MKLDLFDPHPREARLADTERARRGNGDINDPPANERTTINDLHNRAAAVIKIEHLDLGSKGQRSVGCYQAAKMRIFII